ncbi:isoquinoline 1-oxidoreductase beta subunit [Bradyrhizobium sp. LM3.2]
MKRLDTAEKTTGTMIYGIDVKLPGMLNAAIKDCPVFGGKVKSFDEAKIAGMKGVKKIVKVGDTAVAVVADTWWHAKTALEALPIVWDEGDNAKVSSESIAKWLAEGLDNAQPAYVGNKNGDAKAAIATAAKKVEAVYSYPYQNHATMEPMNATALYTADKCEVWCGTQNGEAVFAAVLEASGLPAEKCDVYKVMPGGGFGRRGQTDYVRQAVIIAKEMPGTPIKLLWSREEDMAHGKYHPITQCKMTGAFDADNNLVALHYRLSGQSILFSLRPEALQNGMDPAAFQGVAQTGEAAFGYSVPNLLVEHAMRNPHVPPGFWRGVNVNHNAIYMECFMDELAQAAGQDPLEFRRKLMGNHPKHLAVLNAVAEKIGWSTPAPQGVYRGIAQVMGYGSYVAGAAEISVTDGNKIKVLRIVASTDPGYVVNPAQVERQIAGSFVYGLSALFYGGCTVKDGKIEQTNFDTYNSMRINEMPKVESVMVPSGGFWGGCRRADHRRRGAGGAQCVLRGDGQTHPLGAAARPEHHLRLRRQLRRPPWPPQHFSDEAHESADDTAECRPRHHRRGNIARRTFHPARAISGPRRRDRRRLWRRCVRPRAEARAGKLASHPDRTQCDLHLLPLQQRGDCRPARDRRAAVWL